MKTLIICAGSAHAKFPQPTTAQLAPVRAPPASSIARPRVCSTRRAFCRLNRHGSGGAVRRGRDPRAAPGSPCEVAYRARRRRG